MKRGKLIIIEGTDCSGKQTQSELLIDYLENKGIKTAEFSYPRYDTPTGKIIGGPYLGKAYICEGWFPETAAEVNPKVASLYYAADRLYNAKAIEEKLNEGYTVLLDRYSFSNMGHQGCKFENKEDRLKTYKFIDDLEFGLLELPRPDAVILLYMPVDAAAKIRLERTEALDQLESNVEHLKAAARSYLELADIYDFHVVNCAEGGEPRPIEDIHEDVVKVYESL